MKRLFASSIVVIAAISAVCYSNQNSSKEMNQLAMANIEALSQSEGDGYEVVKDLYEIITWELPDGTVIQESVYVGRDCYGTGNLPC